MKHLTIVGGGGWGTALAIVLAPRFERVRLWVYEVDLAQRMAATRVNDVFLPGASLPANVEPTASLPAALDDAECLLSVMPSHHVRAVTGSYAALVPAQIPVVSATKGIETGSLLRMSQVLEQTLGHPSRIAVLSGPTFAAEVAKGDPTALAIASVNSELAAKVQAAFSGPSFRLYTNDDPVGVELGASLKNVIAIAAGICQGLGLGNNSKAALITRGLAEISRLAVAAGARPLTLAGLAGLGDLVLTCTGELSRNRKVGIELASGKPITEITGGMRMVAEGVQTTFAAMDLARKFQVIMPITEQMESILSGRKPVREALRELMERSLKGE
ncbi:MAG: NAD(P)-dependent glycerol-3-phosphate dehydrogenase [Acidobacteria bacterium]|nr:NAD(P)-dependent glycerol-3-phosphate dehydrogenase [Acidobacteriota bacterium]